MLLKRFYDAKLAQASYLVGHPTTGEALVVDPNRDLDPYLQAAREEGLRITHVTETHIHADFISGARELADRTGARLYLSNAGGTQWRYHYSGDPNVTLVQDGSEFRVGAVQIRVLHVPGHTPEHLAFLVTDGETATEPMGAFTGDFVFVGDVGRPDLLERAVSVKGTMQSSARQLFHSLQRFRSLPDYLQIWPGHGAGSACGKALGAVPQSTLGYEKRFNWAFSVEDEDSFVSAVLAGQPVPPRYFAEMKRINQAGPRVRGEISRPPLLGRAELATLLAKGALVVDTRDAAQFTSGAVPGTINIPRNRSFTTWAGWLIPYDRDFYLIVDERGGYSIDELVRDLGGIGLDRIAGYLGTEIIDRWSQHEPLQTVPSVSLAGLLDQLRSNDKLVLDVRAETEWRAGHVPGSFNLPLGELDGRLAEVPNDRQLIVHCQSGGRAAIAASVLRARGFQNVVIFAGGFAEWRSAGEPVHNG
jgi:hydroxyacylglutathione hydrolase